MQEEHARSVASAKESKRYLEEQPEKKPKASHVKAFLAETPAPLEKNKQREHFARAAGEDDDGYDPWSDRPTKDPFWEEDPWR